MARKKIYSTYEAKAKLSELLDRVQEGESITITRLGAPNVDSRIARIAWLHPDRPLTGEFHDVLAAGYLRGADLWHVAVALWADPRHEITFLTLTTARKRLRVL